MMDDITIVYTIIGKYNFYSNPNNRAEWFPKDLTFKSPNHPKSIRVQHAQN